MFEYAKELVNEKLEADMQKYDKLSEKKADIEADYIRVENFENLKYQLKADKIKFVLSCGLIVSVPGFMFTLGTNVVFIATMILSVMKFLQYNGSIKQINKILNNYSEYNSLTVKELEDIKNGLEEAKGKITVDIKTVEDSITESVDILNMLDRKDIQEHFSTLDTLCLRDAKNYDDFVRLREELYNSLLDNYLNEKQEYFNIHFNEKADYSKKLIKKM